MNSPTAAPPRPSTTTFASSFDGKRQPKLKESSFQDNYGRRHHSYDPEKAPYPVSYDRDILELESIDNRLIMCIRRSMSWVDFKDGPPTRSLDLGCGAGHWVVDAAKEWPHCEFVGFDLVNVQIPLKLLDPSIAERITWVHGNFLTTKLPFDDDEFDHVHVKCISRGVPENKWGVLFEEINRILRPGGVVEVCEDDILFPRLPRWFTTPLRARTGRSESVHQPDPSHLPLAASVETVHRPSHPAIIPLAASVENVPHDHALLESLYQSIFESRFINLRPTAVIPVYFTIYFRQVILGPLTHFPMPPLPPPQPLPPQIISTYATSEVLDARHPQPESSTRPASRSFSSTLSSSTSNSTAVDSFTSLLNGSDTAHEDMHAPPLKLSFAVNGDDHSITANGSTASGPHVKPEFELSSRDGICLMGPLPDSMRGAADEVNALSGRSMAMHLYRAYQLVLACQEAMWEELKDRLLNRKEELKPYGWDDDEELEERTRFERLIDLYRQDMQARVSLWCSLSGLGWPLPPREPLSKAELIEEARVHEGMLAARQFASDEDCQFPCRTGRVFVGYKGF